MTTTVTAVPVSTEEWQNEQAAWNTSADYFVELHEKKERVAQVTHFMDYIRRNRLIPQDGGRTLDIGCGVGDYALGLSKAGFEATGIDLSPGMINGGKTLSEQEHAPLQLFVGPWSEETRQALGWDRAFDFTYSFFCPVMFDPANIEAMSRTSRGKCLLVAFSARRDTIVDALTEHFYGKDDFDWDDHMAKSMKTIRAIGRDVHVDYITTPETEYFTLEEALRYFSMRIRSEKWSSDEAMHAALKPLLLPYTEEDGRIKNTSQDTVAWISWTPRAEN